MRFKLLSMAEGFFEGLEQWASRMHDLCAYCPDCGRNRYTAPPCITYKPVEPAPPPVDTARLARIQARKEDARARAALFGGNPVRGQGYRN